MTRLYAYKKHVSSHLCFISFYHVWKHPASRNIANFHFPKISFQNKCLFCFGKFVTKFATNPPIPPKKEFWHSWSLGAPVYSEFPSKLVEILLFQPEDMYLKGRAIQVHITLIEKSIKSWIFQFCSFELVFYISPIENFNVLILRKLYSVFVQYRITRIVF